MAKPLKRKHIYNGYEERKEIFNDYMKKEKMKTNIIENIMKWWAKITSLVLIFGVFYAIYLSFKIVGTYLDTQETRLKLASLGSYMPNIMTFGDLTFMLFSIVFSVVFGLIFYSPFFYYGWTKNPDSEDWKLSTKIMTTIYSVLVVLSSIFSEILVGLITLVFIIPLYYFAWKREYIHIFCDGERIK